jgi:hypothetical protein
MSRDGASYPEQPSVTLMTYRPADHIPTGRQVLAAWLVCLGIAVSGFGLPALWHEAKVVVHHQLARAAGERPSANRLPTPPHHA